jgi:hypothetical protein
MTNLRSRLGDVGGAILGMIGTLLFLCVGTTVLIFMFLLLTKLWGD